MGSTTYAANLQNVGLVAAETRDLLAAYSESGDWRKVRHLALDQNLLSKRSTTTVSHILKVVRRRYLKGPEWLPGGQSAGSLFANPSVPERAKVEVAYLYTVAEDLLVQSCLEGVVFGSLGKVPAGAYLHTDEVLAYLDELGAQHPELAHWQPYLKKRWSQGLLSLLRETGFMETAPSWKLVRPIVLPEAFGFVFPWLAKATGSPRAALSHPCLGWWGLERPEARRLLAVGQELGWWRYAASAAVVEFKPRYNPGEVLTRDLG